jgi:hypothetical protein
MHPTSAELFAEFLERVGELYRGLEEAQTAWSAPGVAKVNNELTIRTLQRCATMAGTLSSRN